MSKNKTHAPKMLLHMVDSREMSPRVEFRWSFQQNHFHLVASWSYCPFQFILTVFVSHYLVSLKENVACHHTHFPAGVSH